MIFNFTATERKKGKESKYALLNVSVNLCSLVPLSILSFALVKIISIINQHRLRVHLVHYVMFVGR